MGKNITKTKHRFPLRQIRHLPRFFRRYWPVMILTLLTFILSYLNYEPGTFLIGWDNLNPELVTLMNLKRAIFSVWQEGRGLGLLGGQAHSADLPRILLILLFQTLHIPLSFIRYLTTFIPLITGPLGVYFLFYHHLFREKLDAKTTQFASFLGALFYLLNLNTLQTFFVPFETFTWFYGSLPWLLFYTISYIEKPSIQKFSTLFFISLISAPSFYVETIFLVFFVSILPFIVEYFTEKRKLATSFKTVTAGLTALVIPHLYWLLPVAFFVFTGGGQIAQTAKINQISSPQTYYRNLEFANLKDIFLLKGYLFNYLDMGANFKYDYLLSVWRSHLSTPFISLVGYFSIALILIGLYYSFQKKFSWTASFICVLGLSFFFLLGGGLLINQAVPVLGELFRSPFTKFSIPLSLSFSFFFAIGTVFILDLFTFLHSRLTYLLTLFTVSIALILYLSPAFSGQLISKSMKLSLPEEYLSLFSYLKTQDPSGRIANFPQYTFWGWNYYDWNYRGSGFLWHGIKQPLLDRAFDVWGASSERYYEDISSAIFSGNQKEFEKLIDQYAISWVLLDKHVISPDGKTELGSNTLETFLVSSPKFSLAKNFNDQLFLYQTNLSKPINHFLTVENDNSNIDRSVYPFSFLSLRPTADWIEKAGHLSISATPPQTLTGRTEISLPSFSTSEKLIPVNIEYQKISGLLTLRLTPITPVIFAGTKQINLEPETVYLTLPVPDDPGYIIELNDQYFTLRLPAELPNVSGYFKLATAYLPSNQRFPVSVYSLYQSGYYSLTNPLSLATPVQCYTTKPNRKIEKIVSPNGISLLGTDVNACLSAKLPSASPNDLISFSFIYSSPNLLTGNVNISGRDFNSPEVTAPLEPSATPKQATLFTHSTGDYQQLNLILEAEGTKSIQEITYNNIELAIHSRIYSSSISLPKIPTKTISLDSSPERIQVSLPLTASQFDISQTPQSNSLFPENRNCDQFNQGKTVKLVSEAGFFYQSQNAIQCDYLNLRHFSHSLNYLISFGARTEKGLSLTTCLENYSTRRCDIYERLIDSNITQSVIQPIANENEPPGYTLHLFNESIGNRISSNLLKSIIIRPIPLHFLKNISLKPAAIETVANQSIDQSSTSITSSSHPAEFLYLVSLNTQPHSQLSLYQTQSPYWQAVEIPQSDLELPLWLLTAKLFFNYPNLNKLSRTDTNLWYNSWSASNLAPVEAGPVSIAIIYLPQYLQFIGFAVISLFILFILIKFIFSKPRKP